MLFGYSRVSTTAQNLDRQLDNLTARGVDQAHIFTEKITGTITHRPELEKVLSMLREGDTLMVDSFSRLSRSTKDLLALMDTLDGMKVTVISLKENLDTSTATGRMMMTVLAALSQFERDLISERSKEGIKAARARGRKGGRPKMKPAAIRQALTLYDSKEHSISEIIKTVGISAPTLYRYIKARDQAQQAGK